jgi:hypothetical protein
VTKNRFDLQLANLPIQQIDLRRAGGIVRAAAPENARRAIQ